MNNQLQLFEDTEENKEYQNFVEKFKPKKTTDDCYTPPNVYDVVLNYVKEKCNIEGLRVLRYVYPDNIVTVSKIAQLVNKGVSVEIDKKEVVFCQKMDAQKLVKKASTEAVF